MDSRRPSTVLVLGDEGWWVDGEEGDGSQSVNVDTLTQMHLVRGRLPSLGGPASPASRSWSQEQESTHQATSRRPSPPPQVQQRWWCSVGSTTTTLPIQPQSQRPQRQRQHPPTACVSYFPPFLVDCQHIVGRSFPGSQLLLRHESVSCPPLPALLRVLAVREPGRCQYERSASHNLLE